MLLLRRKFTEDLDGMHTRTLAQYSDMKTWEDEIAAQERSGEEQGQKPKRQKKEGPQTTGKL